MKVVKLGSVWGALLALASLALGQAVQAADLHSLRHFAQIMAAQSSAAVVEKGAAESGSLWAKSYSGTGWEEVQFIQAASDGGYYLTGDTTAFGTGGKDVVLIKLDSAGEVQWAKAYGTSADETGSFSPTPDGGFVSMVSSAANSGLTTYGVLKVDANGNILWQTIIGTSTAIAYAEVIPLTGGYFVCGALAGTYGSSNTFFGLKLDSTGTLVWQKQYTGSDTSVSYTPFAQWNQSTGGFIVGGDALSISGTSYSMHIFGVSLDASGNILFQNLYGGTGRDVSGTMFATSDGGFLLEGATTSWGQGGASLGDIWLVKLNSSGAIQWQKAYGGPGDEYGIAYPVSDGYIMGGTTTSAGAGGFDILCMKLDTSGNVVWQETIGGPADDGGAVLPDPIGGYLAEGDTKSFGGGATDIWVLKLNSSGAVVWGNTYGGTEDDYGGAERLSSGNIAVSGYSSATATDVTPWGVLADAEGNVGSSCSWIHPTNVAAVPSNLVTTVTTAQPVALGVTTSAGTLQLSAWNLAMADGSVTSTLLCSGGGGTSLSATAGASTTSGAAPLAVSFTGSASGGTSPYTYSWAFGDGNSSTSQNPSHTYASAGTFAVTLTVTDSTSATATDSHLSITVTGAPPSLTATASASTTSGTAPLAITFTGTASGGTSPYTYGWTFGDGGTGSGASASHTYSAAGTYTVTLKVTDSASHTATDNHLSIHVTGGVTPPVVNSISKLGGPFRFKVMGTNLQSGVTVTINGAPWTSITWKNTGKLFIMGGTSLKSAVPKGASTTFVFTNPDGGTTTVSGWHW